MLNISLKHTAHKLNQAIADLSEEKQQNHVHSDDMNDLHAKLSNFREQMTRIEEDKHMYKQNILHLGDQIHTKINQWNELLMLKYERVDGDDDDIDDIPDEADDILNKRMTIQTKPEQNKTNEEGNFEVTVLSQAITKRNAIITEMEALLIDLTMEISQSATVINRICKNLAKRETNLSSNLEKLRNHLARVLDSPGKSVDNSTETTDRHCNEGKKSKSTKRRSNRKSLAESR